ncbi:MAG TPA: hypothetical protein VG797_08650 [Phycisphaerales bacterium]|nr:hypothetical protein [Phycisphaerales bacterium]
MESILAQDTGNEQIKILAAVEIPSAGTWSYTNVFKYLRFGIGAVFLCGALYAEWCYFCSAQPQIFGLASVLKSLLIIFFLISGHELFAFAGRQVSGKYTNLIVSTAIFCAVATIGIALFLSIGLAFPPTNQ